MTQYVAVDPPIPKKMDSDAFVEWLKEYVAKNQIRAELSEFQRWYPFGLIIQVGPIADALARTEPVDICDRIEEIQNVFAEHAKRQTSK